MATNNILSGIRRKIPVKRLVLRLPVEVHNEVKRLAKEEKTSMNELLICGVKMFLGELRESVARKGAKHE